MNRAETSRANGAQSLGPITAEGKSKSSQNAVKHGCNSKQIVLSHESQAEWEIFVAAYHYTYRPSGPCEEDLVNEIASARWRLRRVGSMERALIEARIVDAAKALEASGQDTADAPDVAYRTLSEDGRALQNLHRYASRLRREYEKATSELRVLQSLPSEVEEEAIQPQDADRSLQQSYLPNEPERAFAAAASHGTSNNAHPQTPAAAPTDAPHPCAVTL